VFLSNVRLQTPADLPADLPPALLARHAIGAIVNLVEWWLESSERLEPRRMASFVHLLVMHPIENITFSLGHG
jgi:hypothetical protein